MARGRHPTRIKVAVPDQRILEKYLRRWRGEDLHREPHRFPRITSQEMFGNSFPLEIDFGCGTGLLACSRAGRFPHANVVGIDESQKPLYCAINQAAALKLDNILFVKGDFNVMLKLLLPQTVSAAFFLFCNPPGDYHLARANARRFLFLQSVYDALVAGGRFLFATDSSAFFQCMRDIVSKELRFETFDFELSEFEIDTRYRSMWEQQGRKILSFGIEKK